MKPVLFAPRCATGQCRRMVHTDQEGLFVHSDAPAFQWPFQRFSIGFPVALSANGRPAHRKRPDYNALKLCVLDWWPQEREPESGRFLVAFSSTCGCLARPVQNLQILTTTNLCSPAVCSNLVEGQRRRIRRNEPEVKSALLCRRYRENAKCSKIPSNSCKPFG